MDSANPLRPELQVLHLEDDPTDAELILRELAAEWPDCVVHRVGTREEFAAALQQRQYDLIISDFSLPGYDGLSALELARKIDTATPFIFVSGTIGEDNAVHALRCGATDYVIKDRMGRLVPAIRRALDEVREHRRRQRAERRLREQAELLDKARDAIVVSDQERRITYWNQGAERIFGWSAADVIDRRAVDLFGPDALQEIETARELVAGGEWHGIVKLHDRHGKPLVLDSRVTVIRDDAGRPRSNLIISTDITEKHALEQQLLRTQRLESIGTLAGGIAHDLNNVLAPILMSVNLLQARLAGDDDLERLLLILESSARHGAGLVRQVLAFARGAEGENSNLDLRLVTREVTGLLADTLPPTIQITIDQAPDLRLVRSNPTNLGQVLMNLCVNARDAMPQGGRITVAATNITVDEAMARQNPGAKPGPHVLLRVSDTGTGIPPAIIDRIFDPFFTTKSETKGTGLGLSTVLGIVRSHGGFLQVDSTPGRGTEFRVYFPAADDPQRPARPSAARSLPRGHGECILVIENEAAVREFVRMLLELHGYRALVTGDGPAGLAVYRQRRQDIAAVVTDIVMPVMPGTEVIRQMQEAQPDVRIVAMSGMLGEGQRVTEVPGRVAFVQKPMTGEDLLRALQGVLPARTG